MKHMNLLLRYKLQFFAADDGKGTGGSGADDGADGDDNQDDDDQDDKGADGKGKKSDKKGKYLTQEDVDRIVEERLKRERKKAEKKQEQAKDDKQGDKGSDKDSKSDENAKKLSDLEMKVLCYDHDISKEYVKEAIALAKAYVDEDTDMDEALELVTKKFPQFVKGSDTKKKKSGKEDDDEDEDEDETDNKKSWGQRQTGKTKKVDPVEARFLERNPGLKID